MTDQVIVKCVDGRLTMTEGQADRLRAEGAMRGSTTPAYMREIVEFLEQYPEEAICDFCSATPVVWDFPARDHLQLGGGGSLGKWAACAPCAALIKRGRRWQLACRSASLFRRSHPEMPPTPAVLFREVPRPILGQPGRTRRGCAVVRHCRHAL